MGDNKVGLQARLMSQALRKLTAAVSKTRTTCIFINQLREKIGVMFGNPETTTGGNALKFYASVRLDIRGSQPIKDGEEILGKLTKVKVVKHLLSAKQNLTSCSVRVSPIPEKSSTWVLTWESSRRAVHGIATTILS